MNEKRTPKKQRKIQTDSDISPLITPNLSPNHSKRNSLNMTPTTLETSFETIPLKIEAQKIKGKIVKKKIDL